MSFSDNNREAKVREFVDEKGGRWVVGVGERQGPDYKGRFRFEAKLAGDPSRVVALDDVRWNNEATARRTLETMSEVELGRRLRWAQGRS
jgi:hypothetical protein